MLGIIITIATPFPFLPLRNSARLWRLNAWGRTCGTSMSSHQASSSGSRSQQIHRATYSSILYLIITKPFEPPFWNHKQRLNLVTTTHSSLVRISRILPPSRPKPRNLDLPIFLPFLPPPRLLFAHAVMQLGFIRFRLFSTCCEIILAFLECGF